MPPIAARESREHDDPDQRQRHLAKARPRWRLGWRKGGHIRLIVALRQSSMGPTFGIKGGGAGGGRSTLEPLVDMNLYFTGDPHAVTSAHNACVAVLDNHLHQGNALGIETITWGRVIDMNDRALRQIEAGRSSQRSRANDRVPDHGGQ